MKITYVEDGVRKSITCDYFDSLYGGSIAFHFNDENDDFGKPQERLLVTLPNTIIESIE